MKVLVLSPYPERIQPIIEQSGAQVCKNGRCDWLISYGHGRILKGDLLREYEGRILNLHISFLPWNRGSDPNLWSWYERTKKGVSLHIVDGGIDTGPIVAQREVGFALDDTLATSYEKLQLAAVDLFAETWPKIVVGIVQPVSQNLKVGSFHRSVDKARIMQLLPFGWNSLCRSVEELGESMRGKEQVT